MVQVNGKDLAFGTWFTIQHEGSATVDLPLEPGLKARFEIKPWTGNPNFSQNIKDEVERKNWEQDVRVVANGNELHVLMPYLLAYVADIRTGDFGISTGERIDFHLVRQQVMGAMLVHIAFYRKPKPNFGAR